VIRSGMMTLRILTESQLHNVREPEPPQVLA
jgi:hypothetical protein